MNHFWVELNIQISLLQFDDAPVSMQEGSTQHVEQIRQSSIPNGICGISLFLHIERHIEEIKFGILIPCTAASTT